MRKSQCDVPVALIFFNRPLEFKKVFEEVRKAAPSKLFLIQDGPRPNNENDIINVSKCKEIVANIDWECEVYTNYSDENLGCGLRVYSGITWAFGYVDRLIILEDDCVPSQSFFPFCCELLEKYINDYRVGVISGMNHLDSFVKVPYDYLFSKIGSIAGWATWRRYWINVDYNLNVLKDDNNLRLLKNYVKKEKESKDFLEKGFNRLNNLNNNKPLTSWSYQKGLADIFNNSLIIVPKYNLMSNIGLSKESVHSVDNINKIPRGIRRIYRLQLYEYSFPLIHPKYIIEDIEYTNEVKKIMRPNRMVRFFRRFESVIYRIFLGDIKSVVKGVSRRLTR